VESKPIVIQFIDSLFRGGAQKVVVDIVDALPDCQHVVCYWSNESDLRLELESRDVTLIKIPFYGMWSLPYAWFRFYKVVRKLNPHYIHSHMFVPNLLVRTLPPKKFIGISTYHGECLQGTNWKAKLTRWIERKTLHETNKVIAVSTYVKRYLIEKLKTNREIEVAHNFGRTGAQTTLNPYLPLRMVATSNNHPYKNYALLIAAMNELRNQPVVLDIFGHGMETFKGQAAQLGLTNISFKGVVEDVTHHFSKYNLFVIVSESGEGFSLALLEAMNSGLPIICSNIPQFVEAVDAEALIFDKSNVNDFVNKVYHLLEKPETLIQLSQGSTNRAQMFSKTIFVNRIRTIYGRA
jgi:glycosyltransferase involved in cell wall biosynthesis